MPNRIVIDWEQWTISYWFPTPPFVTAHKVDQFASIYDVLTCALRNGYSSRRWGEHILILEIGA